MATAHINANKEDIAKTVLMPGDPLRAKYIADNFLVDVKIVNTVRNMYAYTGYYNNKLVTIFPSGMGIPSIGIYAYELYKFYDVEEIIRIGTCGTNKRDAELLDVVLATSSYSLSNYPKLFGNDDINEVDANKELNNRILLSAKENNIKLSNPEVTLFMIIELVGSTCFNSILYKEPLPIEEYKPYLYRAIRNLIKDEEIKK